MRFRSRLGTATVVAAVIAALACGTAAASSGFTSAVTTGKATKNIPSFTWWVFYRPIFTLDPIRFADYPEAMVDSNLCETLLVRTPSYKLKPWLASSFSHPNGTTWVYNIRKGVKFWDGHPLTAADVAYSLNRNLDPKWASGYSWAYLAVKSIKATGSMTVTVKLKHPDALWNPEMAMAAGTVVEKAYAQKYGPKFGSPKVGVMCTGPYTVKSWSGGLSATLVRNNHYWNKSAMAKAKTVNFNFTTTIDTDTQAMANGTIDGGFQIYPASGPTLEKATSTGKLYKTHQGPEGFDLIVGHLTSGPLANPKIRQALSLAIDRQGISKAVYQGQAVPLKSIAPPPSFGYAKGLYNAAYKALPGGSQNLAKAKKLVKEAGGPPKQTIVIAVPNDSVSPPIAAVVQQDAAKIGLKVKPDVMATANYGKIFATPALRKNIGLFITIPVVPLADPLGYFVNYALPKSEYNYNDYNDPKVTKLVEKADATANNTARAKLVIKAQKQFTADVPMIPLILQNYNTWVNKKLTGVPLSYTYPNYPWAAGVGGR